MGEVTKKKRPIERRNSFPPRKGEAAEAKGSPRGQELRHEGGSVNLRVNRPGEKGSTALILGKYSLPVITLRGDRQDRQRKNRRKGTTRGSCESTSGRVFARGELQRLRGAPGKARTGTLKQNKNANCLLRNEVNVFRPGRTRLSGKKKKKNGGGELFTKTEKRYWNPPRMGAKSPRMRESKK